MFKSLIQPLQLFLKGASGKDRHEKQQLSQRLLATQLAYDSLQENYDQLQREHQQQRGAHDVLQREHSEITLLFNYANEENKDFSTHDKLLRSQLQKLEEDNQTLRSKLIYLNQKIELRAYQGNAFTPDEISASIKKLLGEESRQTDGPAAPESIGRSTALSGNRTASALVEPAIAEPMSVNLSEVSLALIGGHETTHREVTEELKKYGLKRCIHVPPHSIASNSRNQIKDKISHCDLVVTITSYVDHSVVRCVKQLRDTQMLAGEVIKVSCHGKSGVVREVLDYFSAQPV